MTAERPLSEQPQREITKDELAELLETSSPIIQNLKDGEGKSRKCTKEDIDKIITPLIPKIARLCNAPLGVHTSGALAIAHCQIEKEDPLRFFVTKNGFAIVNPHIEKTIGKPFRNAEGCMSFALKDCFRGVYRHKKIIASFIQVFKYGKQVKQKSVEIDGQLALIMQHEIDHMNGKHLF